MVNTENSKRGIEIDKWASIKKIQTFPIQTVVPLFISLTVASFYYLSRYRFNFIF